MLNELMPLSGRSVPLNKQLMLFSTIISLLFFSSCLLPYAISVTQESPVGPLPPYDNSHLIELDGVRLHYRLSVPGNSPLTGKILLVHGLGGSTYSFEKTIGVLVDAGYLVAAVDLPGFGYSGRPSSFNHSQEHRAQVLWTLLDRIDRMHGSAPWILLGHSMGAGTVAAMAVAVPGRTSALILVAGALEDRGGLASVLLQFPPFVRWLQVYLERSLLTEKRVASILATAAKEKPDEKQVLAYYVPLAFEGTARALTTMAKSSASLPLVRLEELDMPVAAIWGDLDTVVPLESFARISKHIPHVRLYVLEGSGHLPMETNPVRFNAAVLDFLRVHRVDTRAE